jgi:hypothetical protein
VTKISSKVPVASPTQTAPAAPATAPASPAAKAPWGVTHLPSARDVFNAASDVIDRAVGLDSKGPKPITMGPVDPAAYARMDAKVSAIDVPAPLDATTRARLDRGEIVSTSRPRPDGSIEEKTMGVVNVPLEQFLARIPTKDWGKNLVDWMGGEVRSDGPGRQVERMVLRMPGKDLDMTKIETLTDDRDAAGTLTASRVRWEVLHSENGTVKSDVGTLKFERYGDRTLVTWHSAHALDKFPVLTAVMPKKLSDAATGFVLSDYFTRAIEHYRELTR